MDSGVIGKIQKAKQYAQERERFHIHSFRIGVDGDNNNHTVVFEQGSWNCDCEFFVTHADCAHTRALENILRDASLTLAE